MVRWNLIGFHGFMLTNGTYDVGIAVLFLFQMVFMDTTATIPDRRNGRALEMGRLHGLWALRLDHHLSHLRQLGMGRRLALATWAQRSPGRQWVAGYIDFAGSGVVHAIGGWTALAGAVVLGPRIGKYINGKAQLIPGHNLIYAIAGGMILAFGWFGFNPGSTLGASGNGNLRIGMIAVDTMLASASGAVVAMCYMWARHGKPDAGMAVNGFLAGLVAITAPSGYVSPLNGFIIGAIAGLIVPISVSFFENVLHVDDPVGAISVHGTCGMWGQLSVGLFADGTANYGGLQVRGLFYGDPGQLVAQAIGAGVALVWAFGISFLFFKALDATMGMRVAPQEEIAGLDVYEMGAVAYWDGSEAINGAWPVLPVPQPALALAGSSE